MINKQKTNLQFTAQKAVSEDPRTKEHDIEVRDNDGVISLHGKVPSAAVSRAAESILREFLGIENMINKLHVEVEELDNSLKETESSK